MREEIENKIATELSFVREMYENYKAKGLRIFASSSFQSHSIAMLHILSQMDKSVPVFFADTGFHFPETLLFRDEIVRLLDIDLKIVRSDFSKINLISKDSKFLFITDPDMCCQINKVDPIDKVSNQYDVWITGVRKDQSPNRSKMSYEALNSNGILRFHPMINWDQKMINLYSSIHNLPIHPLEHEGYVSIGCAPCTAKPVFDERSGRWVGLKKTECGLHLNLKS